jgi:hypothetical protein
MRISVVLTVLTLGFVAACEAGQPDITDVTVAAHGSAQALSASTLRMRQALVRDLSRDRANLQRVERSDGVRQYRITGGGFQHATMLVRSPDGELAHVCTSDAESALRRIDELQR